MVSDVFKSLLRDFRAFLRGERRVTPNRSTRGRIYARNKVTGIPERGILIKTSPKVTFEGRVVRKDGSVEELKPHQDTD